MRTTGTNLCLISKTFTVFVIVCYLLDVGTATTVYHIDPDYFYLAETNITFKEFLCRQTTASTIDFIHQVSGQLFTLVCAVWLAHIAVKNVTPKAPFSILQKISYLFAVSCLLYMGNISLYGTIANMQCIMWLLSSGL